MIYDFLMYNNRDEDDMLEIHFHELDSIVDKFVIVQSNYTHSGEPKVLDFDISKFWKFRDKILCFEIDYNKNHDSLDPWVFERRSRDYGLECVKSTLTSKDYILCQDLDEIVKAESLKDAINRLSDNPITFGGSYHHWCADLICPNRKNYDGFLLKAAWAINTSLSTFRQHRTNYQEDFFEYIPNSSWHFSSVNKPFALVKKLKSFAHYKEIPAEAKNEKFIVNRIKSRCGGWAQMDKPDLIKIPITKDYLPEHLINNQERFGYMFADYYE